MTLLDLFDWIARNGWAAFFIGVFFISLTHALINFMVKAIRSVTGNYPPPRPMVECSHSFPCKCCRENDCQGNCDCWGDKQVAEYLEEND